jgi:predicted PurR-regulated permease PerM
MQRDPIGPAGPPYAGPPEVSPQSQQIARLVLALAVIGAGLWVLHNFFAALAWATVFAIALWPLYLRLIRALPARAGHEIAPALLTLAIALVFIVPAVLLGIAVAHEAHFVVQFIGDARNEGVPVPDWLPHLPFLGPAIADWWRDNLTDPEGAQALFGRFRPSELAHSARQYGREIAHRLAIFGFTLLTVFFLFRDGTWLAAQVGDLSDRLIGQRGETVAQHMIAAVHGTVTGLVLVGLAEGFLMGIVYFAVGMPYAASLGAITGVAAIIPFAAPVVYCLCGLYLFVAGKTAGAIVVVVTGSIIVFVADHFVRPFLIGGAARLPFLWVLLGILGGLETFGFLGLFLGPALMAALIALWREWTEPPPVTTETTRAVPARRPVAGRASTARRT